MSKLSSKGVEQLKANILRTLYDESPRALSAPEIASLEIRDKEFILRLLQEMEKKHLVKNIAPKHFSRKNIWIMTDQAYKKYKELL